MSYSKKSDCYAKKINLNLEKVPNDIGINCSHAKYFCWIMMMLFVLPIRNLRQMQTTRTWTLLGQTTPPLRDRCRGWATSSGGPDNCLFVFVCFVMFVIFKYFFWKCLSILQRQWQWSVMELKNRFLIVFIFVWFAVPESLWMFFW